VDKPDIYDASVRWVVASAVLGDSSTQPGFTGPAKCYFFGFRFLFCYAAAQLATQLPQRRIQVVRSNKENPEAPDRIERHSRNGLWLSRNTQTQVYTNEE